MHSMPQHIAIIMDGNGRWAEKKSLPRTAGHRQGVRAVKTTTRYCRQLGIKHLTLFAFSTENWSRPRWEVDFLMRLIFATLTQELKILIQEEVRINIWGDTAVFSQKLQHLFAFAQEQTYNYDKMQLNVALNYGGRWDIVNALKVINNKQIPLHAINEEIMAMHLMGAEQPDPDLVIRTSGEYRLSNFLLWNIAYSELFFTDILWPDFNQQSIDLALEFYTQRQRRYGSIQEAR